MSVQVKPAEQLEFHGVVTAGNPVSRPRGSAEVCQNFRVMPGSWLRLRSGRVSRALVPSSGQIHQIHPFRVVDWWGSDYQLIQVNFSGRVEWHWMNLLNYTIVDGAGFTRLELIATSYDGGYATNHPAACCNLNDRPVFYNGLGTRDGAHSFPAFSSYTASGGFTPRFWGLDAYHPAGSPDVTFAAYSGGANFVLNGLDIYVGLYNAATEHYSNGIFAGSLEPTGGPGAINVNNLQLLTYATHGPSETAELFYVFYSTIDGGQVPYLILNATLDGPYKVPITETSTALAIDATADNGFNINTAQEMPFENFPPRPMRSIAYVNGRIYGVLMAGGLDLGLRKYLLIPRRKGLPPGRPKISKDFYYPPAARDLAAVCWSAAASDNVEKDFLGDPLQSWPLFNLAYTPSGDQPLIIVPALDDVSVLVVTSTSTFILTEAADGIHEYTSVSRVHGIGNPKSMRLTRHGWVWTDQRNQIVLLAPGTLELQILSAAYQTVLTGTVQCAAYVLDPPNLVDRYDVFMTDGTAVHHDFTLGEAYTSTGQDWTAAATAVQASGAAHHIVAKTSFYTREGQPENGLIYTYDQTTGGGDADITGVYTRNWDDFGDADIRKELPMVDLISDGAALAIDWYGDFEEVKLANKKTAQLALVPQSLTSSTWRAKLTAGNRFWYKLAVTLSGHHATAGATYPSLGGEGNLALKFQHAVLRALWRLGTSENR